MGVLDRLLNQEKFTEAFDELQRNNKKIAQELETQKAVNKQLANDFIKLEQKLKEIEQILGLEDVSVDNMTHSNEVVAIKGNLVLPDDEIIIDDLIEV